MSLNALRTHANILATTVLTLTMVKVNKIYYNICIIYCNIHIRTSYIIRTEV